MLRPGVILACLILLSFAPAAQLSVADSFARAIIKMPADTAKVNRLNDLVSKFQYLDPSKAANAATEAMDLAEKINYTLGLATAYRLVGVLYVDRMVLDSGKMYYDKAAALCKEKTGKQFQKQAGLIAHNCGAVYHKRQEYDSATQKYLEAIKIFSSSGQDEFAFFPYTNLATIYSYLKDDKKSLEYAKRASASALKLNDKNKIVSAVNTEMSACLQLEQYDSVLLQLKENLYETNGLNNFYQHGITNNLLARYFGYGKKEFDSAVLYTKDALADMQRVNNEYEIANMLHNLGYYYQQANVIDSAIAYYTKAIDKAKSLGLDQVVQYSLENLVILEEKEGNTKQAYDYLKQLVIVKDTLQQKFNRERVNELEARFQAEKKRTRYNCKKRP